MSQEPWPCSGEDPWLSAKVRTMGVGKALLCSHMPSSIVWSENGPFCGTIACFVGGKREERRGEERIWFNIICLKLYQFKIIICWCLSFFGIFPTICHETYLAGNNIEKKSWCTGICVRPTSSRWAWCKFHRPCTLIHNLPCRPPCRFFIHEIFLGPLGLHLLVWNELGWSPPFRPMRALPLPRSGTFSLEYVVAPSIWRAKFRQKHTHCCCRCPSDWSSVGSSGNRMLDIGLVEESG
jgi:hypothetical protein